jgi:hypothetical protein
MTNATQVSNPTKRVPRAYATFSMLVAAVLNGLFAHSLLAHPAGEK